LTTDLLNEAPIMRARFVAAALLFGAACGSSPTPGGSPTQQRALKVRTAPVAVQDVTYNVNAVGSLEAEELVQVTAEVDGAVSGLRFNEGDRVSAGTVLLRIDPERYRLEVERAEAAYRRSIAEQGRAAADLQRREQLAKEQLISPEELNRARGEEAGSGADVSAAKAAFDIASQNLRRSAVRPPRGGTINSKTVETGQFVRAGTVLATLVDTSRLRLRFKIGEGESLRTKEGDVVAFHVTPLGEKNFNGTVYHVSDLADAATRQVEVLAWVRNSGELKPGFFAEVNLATETHKNATVVPEGAIQASEKGFVVYSVADGKARIRPVQIGLKTKEGIVEIVAGINGGETVVTEGSDRLADGMAVQDESAGPTPDSARAAQ
jgi:membrane fusion protein, multidrug efflux system